MRYTYLENALVATAGGRGAGTTGTCRFTDTIAAFGGRGNNGELQGVVAAAALRAGDLLRLAHHQLLERLRAIIANVFVDWHSLFP